jgi:[ribosomal protein S18]-alanine N-acetyltransferase
MVWQLRRAGVDDLDAIMAIESSTFGSDAWSVPMMRAELRNPNTYYLVAFEPESPSSIDGYAGLLAPRRAEQADIQTIAVVPTARRQGLGHTLVHALIGEARTRGASEIFLEVRADNPDAQRVYASIGFESISVRAAYYQPEGVDAIVMRYTIPEPTTVVTS